MKSRDLEKRRQEIRNRVKLMDDRIKFDSLPEHEQRKQTEHGNNPYEGAALRAARKKLHKRNLAKQMRQAGAPESLIRRWCGDVKYTTCAFHPGGSFIESNEAITL